MCFLWIKKVKVYADVTSELAIWSAGKEVQGWATQHTLLFHAYVSEACVYLDVSKATVLSMCWSVWPAVSALCVCVPCKWEENAAAFIGLGWEESLGTLRPPNLAFFKYHHSLLASHIVILHLHSLLLFLDCILHKEAHRHHDAAQWKGKQE